MNSNKRIRVGNQTAFMALTPIDPFLYAIENNFDAFEWFPDKKENGAGWNLVDISDNMRRYIKETARSHNIGLSVHAPWWANPLTPDSNEIFYNNVDFAKAIGATLLNIHLDLDLDNSLENYARAILPLIKYCQDAGLKLAIENTPLTSPEEFNRLFSLLANISDTVTDHVGMCFDLGHANLCASSQNDYIGFFDRLAPHVPIFHVHLHENYGDHDSHLVIFTGPAGESDQGIRIFLDRLAKRYFQGSIILEQWPDPPLMLKTARDKLINIIATLEGQKVPSSPREWPERIGKDWLRTDKEDSYFFEKIIGLDRHNRSWREKLNGINTLLQDSQKVTDGDLTYLAIYLRYLGTGEISCIEDGRHFRPNHHARISLEIQKRLLDLTRPANTSIIRKIYPWLPSYDSAFTRSEPLTRIRDIAHRNDIPSELKKEIKHTLQNKLHRCADPEDLRTSENILVRITAVHGEYSGAFVEQFQIFHEELLDFFNAASLEKRLSKIADQGEKKVALGVQSFLQEKQKSLSAEQQFATLQKLTLLRTTLTIHGEQDVSVNNQNTRLADIELEGYAFVLLSKTITELGSYQDVPWETLLHALSLAADNMLLSGIEQQECAAISSELNSWRPKFNPANIDQILRLKATLARCERLADRHSDMEFGLFFDKAIKLGKTLEVAQHAIDIYCEGEIRGNIIFQFSKLKDLLLQHIRRIASLPPWDILVPGTAGGTLQVFQCLSGDISFSKETIAVVIKAEGDEFIPQGVNAIVLGHHLPHLSHLAIRTRQQGVVFIVAEDSGHFKSLAKRAGELVSLSATGDIVSFAEMSASPVIRKEKVIPTQICIPDIQLAASPKVLKLHQVTMQNSGAKAHGAKRLQKLSRKKDSDFITPKGVVIPFGVMEVLLDDIPNVKKQFFRLRQRLDKLKHSDEFLTTVDELAMTIEELTVPDEIAAMAMQTFANRDRLMVRSSGSCEDLESLSGAGLYKSVANVAPPHVGDAVRIVWDSLWTKRAAESRQQTGISHEHAYMAVLIQQMITPDYSFIMHTVNPINNKVDEIYIELAVGHGEVLAGGGMAGSPYRMTCDKRTGNHEMKAFADFSKALWPDKKEEMIAQRLDYASCPLSTKAKLRSRLGRRLAAIACLVEQAFGGPQDIEGAIVGDEIWLVQSRPQITITIN